MILKAPIAYMPHVDGLRGIAVLVILLFHLDVTLFKGGFAGVDIFFVISGYLITSIIVREMQAGQFLFADFYARRVKRIFPALFVMLFVSSLAAVVFLGKHDFYEFFKSVRYASVQLSNLFFGREIDYFAVHDDFPPLLHTWSLGVEEQFYLIWPLLLFAVHRWLGLGKSLAITCGLFVVSLGLSEYLVQTDAKQAFYHLHARAWELALGGIVALKLLPPLHGKAACNAVSIAGLGLIAASSLLLEEKGFPGLSALLPCLGAAMVLYSAETDHGWGHDLLSWRPLVWVGLISYSLYLWHWPVIAFYKGYFGAELSLVVQISMAALSFALAWLSYKFVETPTRRSKWSSKKILAAGACAILLFLIGSNIIKNANDASWRVTGNISEDVRWPHDLDKVCADDGGTEKAECVIGPHPEKYEVLLAGDSHASHYAPMVLDWAEKKGLTVRLYMRGACKTWLDDPDAGETCADLHEGFMKTAADKNLRYIFLGGYMPDAVAAKTSLESLKGRKVYFLGQAPVFKEDPHECRIKNTLLISQWFPREEAGRCMDLDKVYAEEATGESKVAFQSMLKELSIPYFDPLPFMETGFDKDGQFMFRDTNHLNKYGAAYLTPHFVRFMDNQEGGRKGAR